MDQLVQQPPVSLCLRLHVSSCRLFSYLCNPNQNDFAVTYPDSIEHKIGFDSVREQIKSLCSSPLGATECDKMSFCSERSAVIARLEECAEMASIVKDDEAFPIDNIHDMTDALAGARIDGSFMTASDLLRVRSSMATMGAISSFFSRSKADDGSTPYPRLYSIAARMHTFPEMISEIDRIIDRWGNIRDNASPGLAAVRSSLSSIGGTINAILRQVMTKAMKEGLLEPDTTPSVRDGRLVIPVSPMNKRKIPGIVHDESASGKTIYIEPAEVVETNNRMRELEIEERREETRILTAMTATLRPHVDKIAESFALLGVFDFIYAKALFSLAMGASMPTIDESDGPMEWYGAFHPVLRQNLESQGKKVVPLDIRLSPSDRILVISGPNAGGKSVTLKTAGVIQYMLQCGLLPTVADNSTVKIMDGIFIDIGDDQSIEDDLSTYSSHLRNMKYLLAHGNENTLMLIDEFGAGTEPQIGGAIAQAILNRLNEKKMWGIVTTHFRNLKQFAEDTPGLINGSMLYDRHKMQPLFSLSIGNPGSSFAVEIARKTGLPESIIADAEQIVGSDYINADKYLLDINRDKRYWENKRISVKQKEKKLDELLEKYQSEAVTLREQRRKIIEEAKQQAIKIIEDSNAAIERTIHDIRRSQADKEKTIETRRRLADQRKRLAADDGDIGSDHELLAKADRSRKRGSKTPATTAQAPQEARQISAGDNVLLDGAGTVGTVTSVSGKNATVIFGNLTTTTRIDRLTLTTRKADSSSRKEASFISVSTREDMRKRQLKFKPDIDIRGMRVDEALQAITYFIDDAVQFNSERVRILHGTGTGALRQSIRGYLGTVSAVRAYHDEDVRLGGAGITVVELR